MARIRFRLTETDRELNQVDNPLPIVGNAPSWRPRAIPLSQALASTHDPPVALVLVDNFDGYYQRGSPPPSPLHEKGKGVGGSGGTKDLSEWLPAMCHGTASTRTSLTPTRGAPPLTGLALLDASSSCLSAVVSISQPLQHERSRVMLAACRYRPHVALVAQHKPSLPAAPTAAVPLDHFLLHVSPQAEAESRGGDSEAVYCFSRKQDMFRRAS